METSVVVGGALRHERFFEVSGDLLCVLDPGGHIRIANGAFRDVLGYSLDVLVDRPFLSIVHAETHEAFRELLGSLESVGRTVRLEGSFLHRDLSRKQLVFSLRYVAEDTAIYCVGRDVTQSPAADERSRRMLDLLQRMEATARVGGWEIDCRTQELYWTEETYRIHEVPPGFVPIVKTAIDFYAPEAVPVITAAVEACMKHAEPYEVELQLITAKKRRIWVRAAGSPIVEAGVVIRVVGSFQDIDDAKRREIELYEKLAIIEQQKTTIHAMSAPIIQVWDGVLALPVVGVLDAARAAELTERLLEEVVQSGSTHAILDLTGVDSVDGATAEHLVRIIRAIRLLGAKSIVTGIQPSVADTLVTLGAGFAGATTLRTLRDALQACMRERKPEIRPRGAA